jgi:hypothetical protein
MVQALNLHDAVPPQPQLLQRPLPFQPLHLPDAVTAKLQGGECGQVCQMGDCPNLILSTIQLLEAWSNQGRQGGQAADLQ